MGTIPGTDSVAVQNLDGTWNVLDVPVVNEGGLPCFNAAGEKLDDFQADRDWFHKIIAVHHAREAEGYMGRAFIDHHDDFGGASQPDAGFLQPTRVGSVSIKGQEQPALFMNLLGVPDHVYAEWIRTGRVPYRSIEALRCQDAFIDGLALMPTRPPHCQLPMLTIGSELVANATAEPQSPALQAVACASAGRVPEVIRRAQEHPMPDNKKIKAMDDEGGKPDEDKNAKAEDGGESTGIDIKALCKSIESGEISVADMAEIKGAIVAQEGAPEGTEDVNDGDTQVAEQAMASKGYDARLVKAQAKADIADQRAAKIEAKLDLRDEIDALSVELAPFLADPKKSLSAKAKEHGVGGMRVYAQAVKDGYPKSPGVDGGSGGAIPEDQIKDMPEVVTEFTDPDDIRVAAKAAREFETYVKAGWPTDEGELKLTVQRAVRRDRAARVTK